MRTRPPASVGLASGRLAEGSGTRGNGAKDSAAGGGRTSAAADAVDADDAVEADDADDADDADVADVETNAAGVGDRASLGCFTSHARFTESRRAVTAASHAKAASAIKLEVMSS